MPEERVVPHGDPGLDWIGIFRQHVIDKQMGQPRSFLEMGVFPADAVTPFDIRFRTVDGADAFLAAITGAFRDKKAAF